MSFIGTVGVVAQQGNQGGGGGSAPTGVSIATSASGNYNNAVTSSVIDGCGTEDLGMELDGSTFSTGSTDVSVDASIYPDLYDGCESIQRIEYGGYLRATGATSYSWNVTINSASLSNGCSVGTQGTGSTSQNALTGLGEDVVITFGGGRGGQTYPANGDSLSVLIDATATNSNGSTSASQLQIDYDFSA